MNAKQYKVYPKYKDSGVEWLGSVPQEWKKHRIKSIIQKHFNGVWGNEEKGDNNDVICLRVADFDRDGLSICLDNITIRNFSNSELNNKLLQKNDLLIEKSGGGEKTLVGAVVKFDTNKKCVCSNFVSCIRLKSNAYSQYINYYFNSLYSQRINYMAIKQTTGIQNIDTDYYFKSIVFLPTFQEQEKIAEFLDAKVGNFDRLVSMLEEQLKLIDEQRNSLITETVCKGLNPKAPMKDSDIEWLGKIPAHWEVNYLFSKFKEKKTPNKGMLNDNLLSLSYGKIIRKDASDNYGLLPESFETYQIVNAGNIIMRLTDLQNDKRSLRVGLVQETGIITSAYVCLDIADISAKYAYYLLHSYDICKVYYGLGGGVRQSCKYDDLKRLKITFPPFSEQEEIIAYLDEKLSKIDALKSKTIKQIELLKEYKTSLITNVVTGKIDVRNEVI